MRVTKMSRKREIMLRAVETVYDYSYWDDEEYDYTTEVEPALDELAAMIIRSIGG